MSEYAVKQKWEIPFKNGVRPVVKPLADAPQELLPGSSSFDPQSLAILTSKGIYSDVRFTRFTKINRQTGQMSSSFIRLDADKEQIPFLVHYAYDKA